MDQLRVAALLFEYPSAMLCGESVLHASGWITQIPASLSVAVLLAPELRLTAGVRNSRPPRFRGSRKFTPLWIPLPTSGSMVCGPCLHRSRLADLLRRCEGVAPRCRRLGHSAGRPSRPVGTCGNATRCRTAAIVGTSGQEGVEDQIGVGLARMLELSANFRFLAIADAGSDMGATG